MGFFSRLAGLFRRAPNVSEAPEPYTAPDRFDACLTHVLRHEGGYVDHPADPGGATNLGITHTTLAAWRGRAVTKQDVRDLSRDEAAAIYRARYWDAVRGDALPPGVDLALFDFAVNSGPARAVREAQAALRVPVDGILGPVTLGAIGRADRVALIEGICDRRMAFLRGLRTWPTFGRGWTRRVAEVETAAVEAAR